MCRMTSHRCANQRKRRVGGAHLVDESDVGFDEMRTIVYVGGPDGYLDVTNMGTRS